MKDALPAIPGGGIAAIILVVILFHLRLEAILAECADMLLPCVVVGLHLLWCLLTNIFVSFFAVLRLKLPRAP